MLAHFLHLLDQAPCPFHTLCLNFTEFQYFSSSFWGARSATASCPASGSASASSSTETSPILGRADFYLQSILITSQKGAFQLRSNFLGTSIFASIDKDNLTRGDIISQIDNQNWLWCWWDPHYNDGRRQCGDFSIEVKHVCRHVKYYQGRGRII